MPYSYYIYLLLLFPLNLMAQDNNIVLEHQHYNTLYIGIENPISIAIQGISPDDISIKALKMSGLKVRQDSIKGQYIIIASKIHPKGSFAKIEIFQKSTQQLIFRQSFRVKRVPDPVAVLTNGRTDGVISAAEMRVQKGIVAILPDFPLDISCRIHGFTAYYMRPGQDPIQIVNRGARFQADLLQLIKNAQAGDTFQIINVKGNCPTQGCGRKLNGLAFQIR